MTHKELHLTHLSSTQFTITHVGIERLWKQVGIVNVVGLHTKTILSATFGIRTLVVSVHVISQKKISWICEIDISNWWGFRILVDSIRHKADMGLSCTTSELQWSTKATLFCFLVEHDHALSLWMGCLLIHNRG